MEKIIKNIIFLLLLLQSNFLQSQAMKRIFSLKSPLPKPPTHLERIGQEIMLPNDDTFNEMLQLEKKVDVKMTEFAKNIVEFELASDFPHLMGRGHQVNRNSLEVSIVYYDVIHEIYPTLAKESYEANKEYERQKVAHKIQDREDEKVGKLKVPMEKVSEHFAQSQKFHSDFEKLEQRVINLNKSLEEIKNDYKMVGQARDGEINMVDMYEAIKKRNNHTFYRQRFMEMFKSLHDDYIRRANERVKTSRSQNPANDARYASSSGKPSAPPLPSGASLRRSSSSGTSTGNSLRRNSTTTLATTGNSLRKSNIPPVATGQSKRKESAQSQAPKGGNSLRKAPFPPSGFTEHTKVTDNKTGAHTGDQYFDANGHCWQKDFSDGMLIYIHKGDDSKYRELTPAEYQAEFGGGNA